MGEGHRYFPPTPTNRKPFAYSEKRNRGFLLHSKDKHKSRVSSVCSISFPTGLSTRYVSNSFRSEAIDIYYALRTGKTFLHLLYLMIDDEKALKLLGVVRQTVEGTPPQKQAATAYNNLSLFTLNRSLGSNASKRLQKDRQNKRRRLDVPPKQSKETGADRHPPPPSQNL